MKRTSKLRTSAMWLLSFWGRVHRDQRGTISIVTVFALFMFTMLLVMVVNVGRHVDDKLRMQNAADAAAYSGGVVIARGMNAIAFSNHLLCEVFALTAYMREGQDPQAKLVVPDLLAAWARVAPEFLHAGTVAGIPKFANLGPAILAKVPLEEALAEAFLEMTAEHSRLTLPVLEHILAGPDDDPSSREGGYIPRFQRVVIRTIPMMADLVTDELARRYGSRHQGNHDGLPLNALLWQTTPYPTGSRAVGRTADEESPLTRTLPAIDPSPSGPDTVSGGDYYNNARRQRRSVVNMYLRAMHSPHDWIRHWLGPFFSYASANASRDYDGNMHYNRPGQDTGKFSQMTNLWRIFSCAHLNDLLNAEYPDTNLPHLIRRADGSTTNEQLEQDHTFVSVAYWPHLNEMFPGLFANPLERDAGGDAFTFAQVSVFIPRARHLDGPWAWQEERVDEFGNTYIVYHNHMDGWPSSWNLWNQNWTVKLVPATSRTIPEILQQQPPDLAWFQPPNFGDADISAINSVSMH